MATVEGRIITVETDYPFRREISHGWDGQVIGVDTGPTCCKADVECDDGMVIKGLPFAGMTPQFNRRVRVTIEYI